MTTLRAPAGLGRDGRSLWKAITGDFDLAAHERLILVQACHVADCCAGLQAVVARDGAVLEGGDGPRTHPACRELRQQRLVLARLLVCLRIPEADDAGRGQYRGPRGVYSLHGAA